MTPPPAYAPDRRRTRAILVATATCHAGDLDDVPQAIANVHDLHDVLTGPDGFFDTSGVDIVTEPYDAHDVHERIAARAAEPGVELLLFYYAGHGLLAADSSLCLCLPRTSTAKDEVRLTSLPAEQVFGTMRSFAAIRHQVAILDCCFSGRAFDAPSAAGLHLLTAANRTTKAKKPEDRRNTAFTGELLRLLRGGVPDGPRHLDLNTIHRRLAVALPAARPAPCPTPWQRAVNRTGDLALIRNRAYGTGRTREGLRSRAWFAERVALAREALSGWPQAEAAALFEEIVSDAAERLPPLDPDVVLYRHVHARLVGEAGDPARAVRLLEALAADLASGERADGAEVGKSLARWRSHLAERTSAGAAEGVS